MSRPGPRLPISLIALFLFTSGCVVAPEPIQNRGHVERSRQDLGNLRSTEYVPTKPIELHEAMARAVAFNLRYRVAEIERAIANAELKKSNYEMLPAFDVNAGRDRNSISVSRTDDRIVNSANATFAWDILDLGVSYARAHQQADKVLIAREQERKGLQDIIRQVNTAFWRAAAGQRLLAKVHTVSGDLQKAVAASREMERTGATDAVAAVAFRRDVVESVKQALAIRRELSEAKAELAELLNIRPGTNFELALPALKTKLPRIPMSVENLEVFALENRPELRVEKYNERISDWQAREALYNLLPGLKLSAGQNYSSNSTNLSANWISTGVSMGMNLFKLFSGSSDVEVAENKAELARRQRLALSTAVLTQVHMARIKFHSATQQMLLAHEISQSDRKLARLVRADGQFFNNDFLEAVRFTTRQLQSEMNEQRSYVDLVSAHADLMHAVGLDVFPETVPLNDLPALTAAVRAMVAQWNISDGTAEEPTAGLPLDKLVNSMISVDTRANFSIAASSPHPPSIKPPDGTFDLTTENLFAMGLPAINEIGASLPTVSQPAIETAAADPPPDDVGAAPATIRAAAGTSAASVEKNGDASPEKDVTSATIARLNKIAPSSQGASPTVVPRVADRKHPASSSPPKTETPSATAATTGRESLAGIEKPDGTRPEKIIIQASIGARTTVKRRKSIASPISVKPPKAWRQTADWEFSVQPRKSGLPVAANGRSDAPPTGRTGVWEADAGMGHRDVPWRQNDISPATIERLNEIAPSSRGSVPATWSQSLDWEFSAQHRN